MCVIQHQQPDVLQGGGVRDGGIDVEVLQQSSIVSVRIHISMQLKWQVNLPPVVLTTSRRITIFTLTKTKNVVGYMYADT